MPTVNGAAMAARACSSPSLCIQIPLHNPLPETPEAWGCSYTLPKVRVRLLGAPSLCTPKGCISPLSTRSKHIFWAHVNFGGLPHSVFPPFSYKHPLERATSSHTPCPSMGLSHRSITGARNLKGAGTTSLEHLYHTLCTSPPVLTVSTGKATGFSLHA